MKAQGMGKAGVGRLGDAGGAPWASLHVFSHPWLPWQAQVCFMLMLLH